MAVVVDRAILLGALRHVSDVVPGRTTLTILSNLLLEADGSALAITGTDLDLEAGMTIPCEGSLAVAVDSAKLVAAVSSLSGEKVSIEPVSGRQAITLKAGRGKRTLSTLPAADFPKRKTIEGRTSFEIRGDVLKRMLDAVSSAMSTEERRYYLCGVFLHVADEKIYAVATDGTRMTRSSSAKPDGADGMADIIVPTKAVNHLRGKLLAKVDGPVAVSVNEEFITVTAGEIRVTSKLVDGTFPDYQRVIPQTDTANTLVVARDDIVNAIGAVASVIDAEGEKKTRCARIELVKDGLHSISARDMAGAEAVEEVGGDLDGVPITFGLNSRFAVQSLGIFAEGSKVTIRISDPQAPVLATSEKDPDLLAVIMPMRI